MDFEIDVTRKQVVAMVAILAVFGMINYAQSQVSPVLYGHTWDEIEGIPPDFDDGNDALCSITDQTFSCPDGTSITNTDADQCRNGVCDGPLYVTGNMYVNPINPSGTFQVNVNNEHDYFRIEDDPSMNVILRSGSTRGNPGIRFRHVDGSLIYDAYLTLESDNVLRLNDNVQLIINNIYIRNLGTSLGEYCVTNPNECV